MQIYSMYIYIYYTHIYTLNMCIILSICVCVFNYELLLTRVLNMEYQENCFFVKRNSVHSTGLEDYTSAVSSVRVNSPISGEIS